MEYLWKYLPIPIPSRWWTKIIIGAGWIAEALIEDTVYLSYFQHYYYLLAPIVTFSTFFATIIGALHLGLGLGSFIQIIQKEGMPKKNIVIVILIMFGLLILTALVIYK